MRGIAHVALGLAATFGVAAPAADARELSAGVSATGSVFVTWHGDRARGCAAAGLCGYRGSASAEPVDGQIYLTVGRRGRVNAYGYISQESTSLARVERREASGDVETCVDVSPPNDLDVSAHAGSHGDARVSIGGVSVAAGRCAGPDLSALLLELPRARISTARLRRGAATVDMSARVPFHSGRFSGRLVSTVRLHLGRMHSSHTIVEPEPRGRPRPRVRVVELHAVYRVTGLAGKFAATFRALAAPVCSGVDACGVSGVAGWAIQSSGGTVVIDAGALARSSDRGLRGLVAAVRRRGSRGYVAAYAELRHAAGVTRARVERSGGASCDDAHGVLPPYLEGRSGRRGVGFVLGSGRVFPLGPDVLRAGCPGPTQAGVIGSGSIAAGRIPLAALARQRVDVPLLGAGRFGDGAYRGAWKSRFSLRLERVKEHLTYRLRRVER
jgi:hypothetical protein